MSERRLSEIAQRLVQPEDVTSSDFKLINGAAVKAGIHYDLWQKGFLYLLFAKRSDGKYACGSGGAVLSSCRQIAQGLWSSGPRTIRAPPMRRSPICAT